MVSIDKALVDHPDCYIVISVPSIYREIEEFLLKKTLKDRIYAFDVEQYEYYNNSSTKVKTYITENIDSLYDSYLIWEDDKSRLVMENVIKARLTENLDYIYDIWEKDQYWPSDIVSFSENEVIVECGSSDGETLKEMLEKLGHRYKKIYCFEPDEQCAELLNHVISEENSNGRIVHIPKGTYSEETELHFQMDSVESGLSYVDEDGEIVIHVTTIDKSVNEPVTYIKMDIEGSELDTLKGAQKTIKTYKPKLAVCMYHRNEDMTAIPSFLKSIRPDYRFYLRHHNCNVTETVLYAL